MNWTVEFLGRYVVYINVVVITYFPRNFKVQNYVDIMLKSTRYFNQTASVTLTLIKRLYIIAC